MKVKSKARIVILFFCLFVSLCVACYLGSVEANTRGNDVRLDSGDTSGKGNSSASQISSDGDGHVYVVWEDNRNGNFDIYFNYSNDNGVTWQDMDIRLDTGDAPGRTMSSDPQISNDGNGHVYVVWEGSVREGANRDIYFNYSNDNGVTWQTQKKRLDTGEKAGRTGSFDPQLSNDSNGHVYVVWEDKRNGNADIYFNYAHDYAVTWQLSDKRLDAEVPIAIPGIGHSNDAQLSNDSDGHVYAVWHDFRDGEGDIYFNYSHDNGVTWQTNDIRLDTGDSPGATNSLLPQLSNDANGHVYVVWNDQRDGRADTYFNYSHDNGVTWQTNDIRLNTGVAPSDRFNSRTPQLSSDSHGHVYVVWEDQRNGRADIYFNYSHDYGVTWQTSDIRLDTGDALGRTTSTTQQLSSDGKGHVYVIWEDQRNGDVDIYFNYSHDYGVTWQASDIRLDTGDVPGANHSFYPQLNSDSKGDVYVVWEDSRNGRTDIYFNYSHDYGVTWQANDLRLDIGVAPGARTSGAPQISSDSKGNVYVVWGDTRNGGIGSIYFNYSKDNGVTWQANVIRLDTGHVPGKTPSWYPQISNDSKGHVYVVWSDRRNGKNDIYFNYSKDNGTTWQVSDLRLETGDRRGANRSDGPQISSDSHGHVYVVWQDSRNANNLFNSIYFNYIFIDEIVTVNDLVSVQPVTSTYNWSPDTTDCPDRFVGKFSFDIEIKNTSDESLSDLLINVVELTGENLLMVAKGEFGSEGATMTVLKNGDYSDGKLDPGESVVVPFVICLKDWGAFDFFVDVMGKPGG